MKTVLLELNYEECLELDASLKRHLDYMAELEDTLRRMNADGLLKDMQDSVRLTRDVRNRLEQARMGAI